MNESTPKPESATQASNAQNATIEAYLDELCAPLSDLPQSARDEIRQEIGAHLQSLLAMKREPERVLESALQQFGDPSKIGRLLALEWENRAWDLGGLSIAQRLEKVRELLAEQEQKQKKFKKGNQFWALMPVMLLVFARDANRSKDLHLIQTHNLAIIVAGVLACVFFSVKAIHAWREEKKGFKGHASCFSAFVTQLSPAFITPVLLIPFDDKAFNFALYVFYGVGALVVVSSFLDPSRKTKLLMKTSMIWGFFALVLVFVVRAVLASLGIISSPGGFWIEPVILGLTLYALRRWVRNGKTRKAVRKNVE